MSSEIEIMVGDVTDFEARVFARYHGTESGIELHGILRGPFCERSRTLPAEFVFRTIDNDNDLKAEAVVPDPCMWTPEMPHVYQADVEARRGERLIAEYHGTVG